MNIFFQELKFYRRSTLIWMAVFAFGIFGYLSLFTAFTHDITASLKLIEGFPPALRAALGIRVETFFTIFGFFGYLLTYLWLVGAIQAMNLGTGILSKEISGKTADFLLTKPVTRSKVLTSKLLAALTLILATNVVFVTAAYFSAQYFAKAPFSVKTFLLISITMLLIQLFFLGVGFLVSVLVPRIKNVLSYSLPIVFGFFIVGLLDSVVGTEAIRYLTPFKYFDVSYLLDHGHYDYKYLAVEALVVLVCVVSAYFVYLRKDIQAGA